MKTSLILFASLASSALVFAQGPEPIPPETRNATVAPKGEEVGISATDGISVSGKDVFVTRNGVSERLTKEMRLTNGTQVKPDGTIMLSDGKQMTLKVDQVLTFEGAVRDVPPRVNPAPVAVPPTQAGAPATTAPNGTTAEAPMMQDGVIVYNGIPYLVRKGRASVIDATLVPKGQMLLNDGSYAPIPTMLTEFPSAPVQKGTQQQTRIGEPGTSPTQRGNTTTGNGPGRKGFTRE